MNTETEIDNSQKSALDKMESDIIQGFIIEPQVQVSSEEATIHGSSCSITSDRNYMKNWDIKRHPVVLLTKLDPGIISLTVKPGWDSFTKLNKSSDGAASCSNSKNRNEKNWYDMEESLSDISVSDIDISDSEDLAKNMSSKKVERERSRNRASKESHSDDKKLDVRKREKMEKKNDLANVLNSHVTATGKKSDKETKEKKTAGKHSYTCEKREEHEKSDVSKKTKTETSHSRRYSKESSKDKEEMSSVDSRRRSRTSTHSRSKPLHSSDSSKSDKIKKSKENTLEQVMPKPTLGKDEKAKKITSSK